MAKGKGEGYEAIPTADPEEALKLIKRGRCRLALVDVHMPGMDGYEFLSPALQNDPGAHVLLMTGDYTLDSALQAIRRGAADFLPKPIDRAHLKKTLDDAAKLYDQRVRQVKVRLIAATNRDLRAEVLARRFREDLFYRLSSIQIRIPSLAERLEDIPLLVQFFLDKYNAAYGKRIAGLTRRAQTVLLQHPWPGNVRELENVISSACITTMGDFVDLGDLPEHLQHRGPRAARMETSGGPCRSKKCARCTSSECSKCARETGCEPRKFWGSGARACTAI